MMTKLLRKCSLALLLLFISCSLIAQKELRMQTNKAVGDVLYLRVKMMKGFRPQFYGLERLGEWQNDTYLPYRIKEQNIKVRGWVYAFYCQNSALTELDVQKSDYIEKLSCANNNLTELKLGRNRKLQVLDCANNKIQRLDLTKNKALVQLNVYGNKLNSLELSANKELKILYCGANDFTTLDLKSNTALDELNFGSNKLSRIDLSKCPKIQELYCGNNQLKSLDISQQKGLKALFVNQNKLTSLTLPQDNQIRRLWCYNNPLRAKSGDAFLPKLKAAEKFAKGDLRLIAKGQNNDFINGGGRLQGLRHNHWQVIEVGEDDWSNLNHYQYKYASPIEHIASSELHIYPNPVKDGRIFLEGAVPNARLRLFTMQGQLIYSARADASGRMTIQLKQLPSPAHYLLQVGKVTQLIYIIS